MLALVAIFGAKDFLSSLQNELYFSLSIIILSRHRAAVGDVK
jgi:hypothetical protein